MRWLLCWWLIMPGAVWAQGNSRWTDLLKVLNEQIAKSVWSSDLHLRKAAAHLELSQWDYAIDEYSLVLQHDDHNPAALFYRAYANTHMRRYELSRRDYEQLLGFLPRHMQARLSLAYVLQLMDRKQEALDQLNQQVELTPDSAVVYAARASLERELKQEEAALYDWQQACRLAPQNADYVGSHVDLLLTLNRRSEALRMLDAATKRGINPARFNGYYMKCRKKK
ncbi:MAG: hypothetical protein IJS95_08360 [Prevotella sp.]|nr:hypothetical protein [Prevotella sp.]